MKKSFKFSSWLLVPLLVVLTACGGGGGGSSSTPATPVLKSIAVTPANPTIAIGTDTITATVDTVSGSTTVTVQAPWSNVVAGGYQTLARKADGTLFGWGSNLRGQLGDSTTTDRTAPVPVSGGVTTWKQIAVGDQFAVAIRTDGTMWSWGNNQNGQLGDGTQVDHSIPAKVGGTTSSTWAFVAAGRSHVLAIDSKGVLWAWGRNFNGQLGDGTAVDRLVPTKISAGVSTGSGSTAVTAVWKSVSAGDAHSLGRLSDGTMYGWGNNTYGQAGNSGAVDVTTPSKIGSLSWASVSAGANHSTAIRSDGTLFAWGLNANGQVGNNGSLNVTLPAQVGTANNWAVVAAGGLHTIAVRTDGTLWAWGANTEGQLGTGDGNDSPFPVQIGMAKNWSTVTAGTGHSFGLQTDGTLWGWGRNLEGQLGNGKNQLSPVPGNAPQ